MIKVAANGFARRWDWQTLQEYGGGNLLNVIGRLFVPVIRENVALYIAIPAAINLLFVLGIFLSPICIRKT
jgi:hypothetical protein